MGNKASSSSTASSASFSHKDFVLGDAHLDSSSPHVVHPNCVSNQELQLVHHRGNNKWYILKKKEEEEEDGNNSRSETTKDFLFAMESPKQQGVFSGSSTQVIVDSKGTVLALLQKTSKGRKIQTLIYRPIPTFDGQSPAMEIYKESVLKKYEAADSTTTTKASRNKALPPLPKYYLFARQLSNPAANPSSKTTFGDSSYALLQVDVVYNDPDFAKFKEPPLYRAVTIRGGGSTTGTTAIIMDGSTNTAVTTSSSMAAPVTTDGGNTPPTTILGTVTKTHANIANGVDLIAVLTLGSSALMSPPTMVGGTLASPRGAAVVDRSGVV